MKTLLLLIALSVTVQAQKAIGYQVVTQFPGSPAARQTVIKNDSLWTYRNGEWRLSSVPDALISGGGGSTDSSVFATNARMVDSLDNFSRLGHTHTGGSDPWTVYRRTADTTKSTNTPVSIGGMGFNVVNGTIYLFKYVLIYQAPALTTGIRTSLIAPTGTLVAQSQHFGHAADGVGTPWAGTINASADIVTSTAVAVINVNYRAIVEGTFIAGANGQVVLQWAPEVAAAATLKAGSIMMYRSIP